MEEIELVTEICLSFPEVTESPHFEKTSFRIRKKIFATLGREQLQLVVKLSEIDQSVFSEMLGEIVYPVPGAWGRKGWTIVELNHLDREEVLIDILTTAYKEVAPKKLGDLLE